MCENENSSTEQNAATCLTLASCYRNDNLSFTDVSNPFHILWVCVPTASTVPSPYVLFPGFKFRRSCRVWILNCFHLLFPLKASSLYCLEKKKKTFPGRCRSIAAVRSCGRTLLSAAATNTYLTPFQNLWWTSPFPARGRASRRTSLSSRHARRTSKPSFKIIQSHIPLWYWRVSSYSVELLTLRRRMRVRKWPVSVWDVRSEEKKYHNRITHTRQVESKNSLNGSSCWEDLGYA